MPSPNHPKLVFLSEQLSHAQKLSQNGQDDDARGVLDRLLAESEVLGIVSPALLWTVAVVADRRADFPTALEFIRRAVEADPVCPTGRSSRSIILGRIRNALLADERRVEDDQVPMLYTLLASESAADEACHVRFAAHLVATGKVGEASDLLAAVVKLHPQSLDAWTLLVQVAEPGRVESLRGSVPKLVREPERQGSLFPQAGLARC